MSRTFSFEGDDCVLTENEERHGCSWRDFDSLLRDAEARAKYELMFKALCAGLRVAQPNRALLKLTGT